MWPKRCIGGVGTLQRAMHRVVGQVEEERPVAAAIDKIKRFASQCVGQVRRLLDRLAATQDGIVRVIGGFVVSHVCPSKSNRPSELVQRPPLRGPRLPSGSDLRRNMVVTCR